MRTSAAFMLIQRILAILFAVLTLGGGCGFAAAAEKLQPNDWRRAWLNEDYMRWSKLPLKELLEQSRKGDPVAQHFLWERYVKLQDDSLEAEAEAMLEESIKSGLPQSLVTKSFYLMTSRSETADADHKEGVALLVKAADLGFPTAKFRLAGYYSGYDSDRPPFAQDAAKALAYYRDAVSEDMVAAFPRLAILYSSGIGEPRSPEEEPRNLLLRAANWGNHEAMLYLSDMHLHGCGIPPDLLEAARWRALCWTRSRRDRAEYFDVQGVPIPKEDPTLAELSRIAALHLAAIERNDAKAAATIADYYLEGKLGGKNRAIAGAYLRVAADAGSAKAAAELQKLKAELSDDEKRAAQAALTLLAPR